MTTPLLTVFETLDQPIPEKYLDEDVLQAMSDFFDWPGAYESYIVVQSCLGLPIRHHDLGSLIQAEAGAFLHDIAVLEGEDLYGTFESEDWDALPMLQELFQLSAGEPSS